VLPAITLKPANLMLGEPAFAGKRNPKVGEPARRHYRSPQHRLPSQAPLAFICLRLAELKQRPSSSGRGSNRRPALIIIP
jgi:hypothetical protein